MLLMPGPAADSRLQWPAFLAVFAALAVFFAAGLRMELQRYPVGAGVAAALYASLLLLFALWLAPGFLILRPWLAARLRGPWRAAACAGFFTLPYLIYAIGAGDFRWAAFARLLVFALAPFLLYAAAPVRRARGMNWQDILMLLWLALPVLLGGLRGIWNVPVNLDFMARLFIVAVGAWAFLIWRGLEDSGYEFRFSGPILRAGLLNFLGFAAAGIPLGFALRFVAWNPHWRGWWSLTFDAVTIFLFIAVSEELFFRGLLQNLLEGSSNSRYGAQAAASVLFGFSHIRHAPFPNWRYVILATIAGWFYGAAYRKTRSLMASATTHALVDTIWRTWLTLPHP
jgi:membrane protease YdiL (CAAX protease family)